MNLFELDEGTLHVAAEALAINVFNTLYTRDKKKSKSKAMEEFSYIYFFCDFKSDFADIINEQERHEAIVESTMTNPEYKPDAVMEAAMQLYEERSNTITSALLDDAKSAVYRISKFLKTVDLNERDEKSGKPVHNPKNITGMVGDMSKIVENISVLEQKVKRELDEESNMKGGRKKGLFEDGI